MASPTLVNTGLIYFYPEQQSTLACTNVSSSVGVGINGDVFVIYNAGPSDAFLNWGINGTATAAVAGGITSVANDGSFCVPAGTVITVRADPTTTSVQGICSGASSTATIRISRGSGQ